MAIFETTAKNSVLGRSVHCTDLQSEKKMKKFDLVRILSQNHEIPLFCTPGKKNLYTSYKYIPLKFDWLWDIFFQTIFLAQKKKQKNFEENHLENHLKKTNKTRPNKNKQKNVR